MEKLKIEEQVSEKEYLEFQQQNQIEYEEEKVPIKSNKKEKKQQKQKDKEEYKQTIIKQQNKPLKQKTDNKDAIKALSFLKIGQSEVTLWHRPGVMDVALLKVFQNITMIVSLLHQAENPNSIRVQCDKNDIKHFHIELKGANQALLSSKDTLKYLLQELPKLYKLINENEEKVLIHCAAGIHRTGTISYTLLRMSGLSENDAFQGLGQMRQDTMNGVMAWRIELAEKHLVPFLVQKQTEIKDQQEEEKKE